MFFPNGVCDVGGVLSDVRPRLVTGLPFAALVSSASVIYLSYDYYLFEEAEARQRVAELIARSARRAKKLDIRAIATTT